MTDDVLIPAPVVRAMCGSVSNNTLYRWLYGAFDKRTGHTTPPLAGFPQPLKFPNGRLYWKRAEVEAYTARFASKAA